MEENVCWIFAWYIVARYWSNGWGSCVYDKYESVSCDFTIRSEEDSRKQYPHE